MKLFETPVVEVIKFAVEDVITVSGGTDIPGPPPPNQGQGTSCF